jgi:hypothetical protein
MSPIVVYSFYKLPATEFLNRAMRAKGRLQLRSLDRGKGMRGRVFVAATLWLTPVIAVGLTGVGLSHVPAIVMGLLLAAAIGRWASGPFAATLSPVLAGRRVLTITVMLVAAVAIVQIARESVYMADSTKPAYSVIPGDPWRVEHSCMSAYFEAARFAEASTGNVWPSPFGSERQSALLRCWADSLS